jgi:predicted ArsR family transcriptional regulator
MIRDTSLMAYRDLQTTNKLSVNRKAVLDVLLASDLPLTDKEIAARLGWAINRVTGRRGELVAVGLVEKAGKILRGRTPETLWRVARTQLDLEF